ncbi:MAG: NADase-type glycan-binding domain-containing protein [Bacteroidota bacterium]
MKSSKRVIFIFLLLGVIAYGSIYLMVYSEDKSSKNNKEIISFLREADQIKFKIKYELDSNQVIGQKDGVGLAALVGQFSTLKDVATKFGKYFSIDAAIIEIGKVGLYSVNNKLGSIMAEGSEVFLIDKNTRFDFLIDEPTRKFIKINMGSEYEDRKDFYYDLKFTDGHWLIVDQVDTDNVKHLKNSWVVIRSSSDLFDSGKVYKAIYVMDKDLKTAWVPTGREKNGIGEWLDFKFYPGQVIKSIQIINGYAKSEAIYQVNNRVKRFKLSFDNGTTLESELKDRQKGFQTIPLTKPQRIEYLRMTILEVYPGTKYHDTCISEVNFQ